MLKSTRGKGCKLLSLILSMLLVVTTVPAFSFTASADGESGFEFGEIPVAYADASLTPDTMYGIKSYTGTDTIITVPSSNDGKKVEYIGDFAFADNKEITIVRLPDTIRGIGKSAFVECSNLNTVVIGTNASISDFGDFEAYPAVLEKAKIFAIEDRAFANCGALRHFAVYTSKKISELSVTDFAAPLAFAGCTDITYYGWGTDNIISDYAGTAYKNLLSVSEEVESLSVAPKSVFMALKETVQLTVTILPNDSLAYGENICSFISSNPDVATVSDGGVVTAVGFGTAVITATSINDIKDTCTVTVAERVEGNYIYRFLDDGTVEIVQFNSGVTGIVEIPDTIAGRTVTSIGDYAFMNCSGVREIKLPDTIDTIKTGAFYGCTELAVFETSPSLISIESAAFYGCSSLAFINLTKSLFLANIGDAAFRDCTSLAAIFLPESITAIGKDAFIGDAALKIFMTASKTLLLDINELYFDLSAPLTIYYNIENTELKNYAIDKKITYSDIIDNVTALVFSSLKTSLILGEAVDVAVDATIKKTDGTTTEVPNYDKAAFAVDNKNVINLKNGKLVAVGIGTAKLYAIAPNSFCVYADIEVIAGVSGDYEYRLIDNMNKAEIIGYTNKSEKIAEIPEFVDFNGADIPVTSIGNAAFENTLLTSIKIGANITSVNGASFDCAYALEEILVAVGNTGYAVVDGVLFNSAKTTLVKYPASKDGYVYQIPSSVTTIGDYAFKDNKNLTYIKFPSKLTRVGDHSFESMERLMSAVLPLQVTHIGSFAFAYNSHLDYISIPKATATIGASAFVGTPITIYGYEGYCAEEYAMDNSIPFKNASLLVEVSELRLSASLVSLGLADTHTLTVDVYPKSASFPVYFFESSDPEIATVDADGVIRAVTKGETEITVMSSCGVFAKCVVKVDDGSSGGSNVENAVSVAIILQPDKTEYENGENLDFKGGLVEATLQDGMISKTITIIDGEGNIASGVRIRGYNPYKAGSQTIEIIFGRVYTTMSVTVLERKLTGISVTRVPDDTTCIIGLNIDPAGLIVTGHYNNGESDEITDYTLSAAPAKVGPAKITVTAVCKVVPKNKFTATFDIEVLEKSVVSVSITPPSKTTYYEGNPLELAGFTAVAYYDNGTTAPLYYDDFVFTGYDSSKVGHQRIKAIYTDTNGNKFENSFYVTVLENIVTKLEVALQPIKLVYENGEALDFTGATVYAYYSDGSKKPIINADGTLAAGVEIRKYNPLKAGDQSVQIVYEEKIVEFKVTVLESLATKLEVALQPIKLIYENGEALDFTGATVYAYYSDGSKKPIINADGTLAAGVEIRKYDPLKAGSQSVQIVYEEKTVEFTVTVLERKLTGISVTRVPNDTTCIVGLDINPAGLIVTGHYNNGQSDEITDYTLSAAPNAVGPAKITVTAACKVVTQNKFTATFDIEVLEKSVVSVSITPPSQLTYYQGYSLDLDGFTATAYYNNNTSSPLAISELTFTGHDINKVGKQKITVSYTAGGKTFDNRFNITVLENAMTGLEIKLMPIKLTYENGEPLDFKGASVYANYSDGLKRQIINENGDFLVGGIEIRNYESLKAGNQTVQIVFAEKTVNMNVTVLERKLTGISVTRVPNDTTCIVGLDINPAGLIVTGHYNNGQSDEITDYTLSAAPNAVGPAKITVTAACKVVTQNKFTATFDIEVLEKSVVSVSITPPSQLTYYQGHKLDFDGFTATAYYDNNTSEPLYAGQFAFTGYNKNKAGKQEVTASYTADGKTFTNSFNVMVLENIVTRLEVVHTPRNSTENGKSLPDFAGALVYAYYSDGLKEQIIQMDGTVDDGVEVRNYEPLKAGNQTVQIIFAEKTVNMSVTVLERVLLGIAVTKKPDKLIYIEGSQVDTTGLVITASYNNGQTEEVTDYTVSVVPSSPGTHPVTVSYGGFTAAFSVTVIKKTLKSIEITPPKKTAYVEGDDLDLEGFTATVYYDNGTSVVLGEESLLFAGFNSNIIGNQKIDAIYSEDGVTVTKSFYITIAARTLKEIQIVSQPDKQVYVLGETLDITGLEVVAVYDNSTSKYLSPAYLFEFENIILSLGDNYITVQYKENKVTCSATFKVFVELGNYNGEFTYKINDGGIEIVKILSSVSGNYTIPEKIGKYPVKMIANSAFRNNSAITSVVIPNSVTSMGIGAFENCGSLTSVTIGSGITKIPDKAFYKCKSLKSVIIPSSVTEIGELAFARCDALETVTIPSSVVKIDKSAFDYNNKNFKIISAKNSAAHQYALDNKVKWEADIGYILGDVNGNGKVEVDDARLALRHAVELQTLDSKAVIRADYNKNGEVSVDDARSILRKAVGLD